VDRVITKGMDKALIYFSNHDFGALNSFFLPRPKRRNCRNPARPAGKVQSAKHRLRRPEDSAGDAYQASGNKVTAPLRHYISGNGTHIAYLKRKTVIPIFMIPAKSSEGVRMKTLTFFNSALRAVIAWVIKGGSRPCVNETRSPDLITLTAVSAETVFRRYSSFQSPAM